MSIRILSIFNSFISVINVLSLFIQFSSEVFQNILAIGLVNGEIFLSRDSNYTTEHLCDDAAVDEKQVPGGNHVTSTRDLRPGTMPDMTAPATAVILIMISTTGNL